MKPIVFLVVPVHQRHRLEGGWVAAKKRWRSQTGRWLSKRDRTRRNGNARLILQQVEVGHGVASVVSMRRRLLRVLLP